MKEIDNGLLSFWIPVAFEDASGPSVQLPAGQTQPELQRLNVHIVDF